MNVFEHDLGKFWTFGEKFVEKFPLLKGVALYGSDLIKYDLKIKTSLKSIGLYLLRVLYIYI